MKKSRSSFNSSSPPVLNLLNSTNVEQRAPSERRIQKMLGQMHCIGTQFKLGLSS